MGLGSPRLLALLIIGFLSSHSALPAQKVKKGESAPSKDAGTLRSTAKPLPLIYLSHQVSETPIRPFFDPILVDEGINGAELGIIDNNTTGQFTGQTFELKKAAIASEDSLTDQMKALLAEGYRAFLLDLTAEEEIAVASLPEASGALLFNIAASDDRLRGADCRKNLLHIAPSHAMKADALAQYLSKKRWQKWFLVTKDRPEDLLYAQAIRASAKKFGARLVADKPWTHTFDARRTPESEIPVFTQEGDYEVVVIIDSEQSIGDLFAYRTWLPRPIAGTAGLIPSSWHLTHEAWGALQLQKRFTAAHGRPMKEKDYAAWLAVRAMGEAATRTKSTDVEIIRPFLLGDGFALAGFKGVPLSFRSWDHQLRQPLLLGSERATVAVAPIEGYLHPKNELDSLGIDQPESLCKFQ